MCFKHTNFQLGDVECNEVGNTVPVREGGNVAYDIGRIDILIKIQKKHRLQHEGANIFVCCETAGAKECANPIESGTVIIGHHRLISD